MAGGAAIAAVELQWQPLARSNVWKQSAVIPLVSQTKVILATPMSQDF